MKKSLFLLLGFLLLTSVTYSQLKVMPEAAKPGDMVKLKYLTDNSSLKDFQDIKLVAFVNTKDKPEAFDIETNSGDGYLKGKYEIPKDACSVFFAVKANEGTEYDANGGKGYYMLLTDELGKPVQYANSSAARTFGTYYRFVGLERDLESALMLMKKEFELFPTSKAEKLGEFAAMQSRADKEAAKSVLEPEIASLLTKRKKTEKDYSLMQSLYNYIGNTEKATELEAKILKKFPKGDLAFSKKVRALYDAKTAEAKAPILDEMANKFNKEPKDLAYYHSNIANAYANDKNWDKFNEHLNQVSNSSAKASALNNAAWKLTGGGIDEEAEDAEMARKLAEKAIKLIKDEVSKPDLDAKPSYYTTTEWQKSLQSSLGMYADTYALSLYKTGDVSKALKYQKKSCGERKWKDPELNERYCVYHYGAIGGSESEIMMEKMIREGHGTTKINELYKTAFLENHTLESAFDKYYAEVEKEAKENLIKELKNEMIDLEAPTFVLKNLSGEEVSLASLKGKVVIVDFWATWCGPCKASFPGMQKAVDKFAADEKVAFLFVDSWERGEEKEKNATEFINEHAYTFNVLMDNDDKVINSFKVGGIPTKFILGTDGRIRFKSVGFDGNTDKLVDELSMMIELLKKPDNSSNKSVKISMSGE